MTAIELKTLLIHRISEIDDVSFLRRLKLSSIQKLKQA